MAEQKERERLKNKLSSVPTSPGVYIFKDSKEKILYVGKAKSLRNRMRSYFQKSSSLDDRKTAMMRIVADFSYIVTDNELEALALEANLIKQNHPRFNVILRDDKNYPYIKITLNEEWPRIEVVRRVKKDGALYYGPYVPAGNMRETLDFIRNHFHIRPCRYRLDKPMRPCIQYQMGRCPAPCAGLSTKEEYMAFINEVRHFLSGERKGLLNELRQKMKRFSDEQRYEEAAVVRDRIAGIEAAWESQKVVLPGLNDLDVIGHHTDGRDVVFQVFFIRNGLMIGSREFHLPDEGTVAEAELYYSFIEMFYSKEIFPPPEILTARVPADAQQLLEWLRRKRDGAVRFTMPSRGKKRELVEMARKNAEEALALRKGGSADAIERELKKRLLLKEVPHSIGAFDVSNTGGGEAVGSFVFWREGAFVKDNYRRFKIKDVEGIDDYAMMREIVGRLIKNPPEEYPDLILIDGGRGQLDAGASALEDSWPADEGRPPGIVSIAKRPDRIFTTTMDEPVDVSDSRGSSLLLRRIRDEAHRFAIGFHRKLRDQRVLSSPLEKVPGVGRKRRLALLRKFGGLKEIRDASVEELSTVPGINTKTAEAIKAALEANSAKGRGEGV